RAMLLRYFGEDAPDRCGFCDSCDSGRSERVAARLAVAVVPEPRVRATARQTAAAAPAARSPRQRPATAAAFAPGTWAEHRAFGRGMVVGRDGDHVEIAFQTHGKRKLSLALALSRGILKPAAAR
ncbi:MAG: RecQ family zinc-binding domain-containing protein, partial [Thermodesulfobacteriota bacterium]